MSSVKSDLLESIDLPIFLEHIAPGEWERFPCLESAFDFFIEGMSPQELKRHLDESGCRL